MSSARFRFHGGLGALLPAGLRACARDVACARDASLKHAIEALGVPHTEVGGLRVDGREASLDEPVSDGSVVDVLPPAPGEDGPLRFLADAHLGALARRLRLLGFDTLLASDGPDHVLAAIADEEDRILLSRDRELLKHRRVRRGRLLRAQQPQQQLAEVAQRYGLRGREHPFSRCLECNGLLEAVSRAEVLAALPPAVAAAQRDFRRCAGCGRVYWPGSHWRRLSAAVDAFSAS